MTGMHMSRELKKNRKAPRTERLEIIAIHAIVDFILILIFLIWKNVTR